MKQPTDALAERLAVLQKRHANVMSFKTTLEGDLITLCREYAAALEQRDAKIAQLTAERDAARVSLSTAEQRIGRLEGLLEREDDNWRRLDNYCRELEQERRNALAEAQGGQADE